jgi:hypothetical protein
MLLGRHEGICFRAAVSTPTRPRQQNRVFLAGFKVSMKRKHFQEQFGHVFGGFSE